MNFNKKVINEKIPMKRIVGATSVTLALSTMVAVAGVNSYAAYDDANYEATAGVFEYLNDSSIQISGSDVTVVGLDSDAAQWVLTLMANVEDYVYVRTAPSVDAEVAGKLRKGDTARVESLTQDGQWYQIISGNLAGYVKADMCVTGENCRVLAMQVGASGSTGITVAEEAQIEAEKKAAALAEAKEKNSKSTTSSKGATQKESYNASCDELTLLAAIIEKEDGSDGYEGQLAVGCAVMNRVRSSSYPNTIEGVIDQKGQFTGGIAGLQRIIARGPSSTSMRAAEAALSGVDTIDGLTNFRGVSTGHSGMRVGEHVFF